MKTVDLLIVGGATTGSYFARRMAEHGLRVLVIEALSKEKIGTKYDIFHICERDFAAFNLPKPVEDDPDWGFSFSDSTSYSAYGKHPKPGKNPVIGMHLHEYTLRLNRWAEEAGAEIVYEAAFINLRFDENGKVCGAVYEHGGETVEVAARLVADCSGIPSAARRSLPDTSLVENFRIGPDEMFYVTLRYVNYPNEADHISASRSWTFYKTWEAPQHDPTGAILGIGANFSFDFAEKIYNDFEGTIFLPPYTLHHIERGTTPYRRPPYSFVDDGFIVMGDAACLTKPSAGEGVTSSMVQANIAVDVIAPLLLENRDICAANMWPVNKLYIEAQGKAFASQLAMLVGAVATNKSENDFFFEKDIIFSARSFEALGEGKELEFSIGELAEIAAKMGAGVICGRLRPKTISSLLKAMSNSGKISKLYSDYPSTPGGFAAWKAKADALWAKCGSMADHAAEMLGE